MKTKHWILGSAALLAIAAAVGYQQRVPIAMKLVGKVVSERMENAVDTLPDGLHIGLCGTGSPFPDPERSAPCTLVIAGKNVFLFDAGSGSAKQISTMGFATGQIKSIFLTHFHSDHIDGLGEVMMTRWAQNTSGQRLTLRGPQGTAEVYAGFEKAYAADSGYRTAHHGEATMPPNMAGADVIEFEVPESGPGLVFKDEHTVIETFRVNHSPIDPAVGYRIRYKDRTVVLSGDTKADPNLAAVAQGVDLMVHEALNTELVSMLQSIASEKDRPKLAKIFHDIPDYHTSPEEVAKIASQADVGAVVLSHIVPPLPLAPLREVFLGRSAELYDGPFKIGEDGDFISLPSASREIQWGRRWHGR